jgi:hypothetical protein
MSILWRPEGDRPENSPDPGEFNDIHSLSTTTKKEKRLKRKKRGISKHITFFLLGRVDGVSKTG